MEDKNFILKVTKFNAKRLFWSRTGYYVEIFTCYYLNENLLDLNYILYRFR